MCFFQNIKVWKRRIRKCQCLGLVGARSVRVCFWSDGQDLAARTRPLPHPGSRTARQAPGTAPGNRRPRARKRSNINSRAGQPRASMGVHQIIIPACWGCFNETVILLLKWVFNFYFCFDVIGISKVVISYSDLKIKIMSDQSKNFLKLNKTFCLESTMYFVSTQINILCFNFLVQLKYSRNPLFLVPSLSPLFAKLKSRWHL